MNITKIHSWNAILGALTNVYCIFVILSTNWKWEINLVCSVWKVMWSWLRHGYAMVFVIKEGGKSENYCEYLSPLPVPFAAKCQTTQSNVLSFKFKLFIGQSCSLMYKEILVFHTYCFLHTISFPLQIYHAWSGSAAVWEPLRVEKESPWQIWSNNIQV